MRLSNAALLALCLLGGTFTSAAEAQEYGVLVGTVTPGVGAQARGLGAATAGAIGRAANTVAAVNARTGASSAQGSGGTRSGPQRIDVQRFTALPVGDPLQGTDAPSYALGNGRTIRVSGAFMPDARPFDGIKRCMLDYGAITASGGMEPSGPPRDDCRNVRS